MVFKKIRTDGICGKLESDRRQGMDINRPVFGGGLWNSGGGSSGYSGNRELCTAGNSKRGDTGVRDPGRDSVFSEDMDVYRVQGGLSADPDAAYAPGGGSQAFGQAPE